MMEDAVYARQSVEKLNSISIEGQIDLCQKCAGTELKVYQDRGYSGKNTERPAFKKLLQDIQAGKIRKLYVYRLDRFSRSVADFGRLWEILQAHNVEFVSVSENFDTTTPMGRAMLHIIMVFAQLERETTAERVKDNYYRRASLGSWPGGPAPFGYKNSRIKGADGRDVPTLTPTEDANMVIRIFEEYAAEGATLGSVAKRLNSEGVHGPQRNAWDNVSLSRLLHSPTYVMADEQVYLHYKAAGCNVTSPKEDFDGIHGVLLVGKRDRAQKKYTDIRNHSVSMLNSVGIVPAELWLQCQNKLALNRQLGNNGKGTYTWLTGLLKCAECGYSLSVMRETKKHRLVCSGRYKLQKCKAIISVCTSEIEQQVEESICALLDECPEEPVEKVQNDSFQKKLEELDRKADRLLDAFSESTDLSPVYLKRKLAQIEEERQALLDARKRENARPAPVEKLDFHKLSFEEKKTVAAQFIQRINVSRYSVEIIWNV